MRITYIGHSGFLLEWAACYWLFDYYQGEISAMDEAKKIFVFASHRHADHFNPEIFKLAEKYPDTEYVLSSDIRLDKDSFRKKKIPESILERIVTVQPSEEYCLMDADKNEINLTTLRSTDCGVAFLLRYRGKTVYHAGDLNLWVWKEESRHYNDTMKAKFQKEMDVLNGLSIDIAFAPLDPRQEEYYNLGLDALLNTAKVRMVFPMHFWDNPSVIRRFLDERDAQSSTTEIMDIRKDGQTWEMDI